MKQNSAEYLRTNLHTHTWRCMHATGTEKEFVEKAIESGIKLLGFSDHSPMPFPNDHVSGFRMRPDQLEDYCRTVEGLKKEYAADIEIHIGLEAEYYPKCFDALLELLHGYPIEYLLLGQHCTMNEYDGAVSGYPTEDRSILDQYVKQVVAGMETGRFLYLAHPDIIYYVGDENILLEAYREICRKALSMEIPLEINMLGIHLERTYPEERFWKVAGEVGNDVVIGVDCHHVNTMYLPEAYQRAMRLVKNCRLKLMDAAELTGRFFAG